MPKVEISFTFKFENLNDVKKFGEIMRKNNIDRSEINISEIANNIGKARSTVVRYLDGFEKTNKRNKNSKIDKFHDRISHILSDGKINVKSKQTLYEYLIREYPDEVDFKANTFRHYINKHFKEQFAKRSRITTTRYETEPGEQAQFDFKEDFKIDSLTGEKIKIDVAVFQLGFSRNVIRKIVPDKTTDTVICFLTNVFIILGGVPRNILFDNAKCIATKARNKNSAAVINSKFYEFSKDMGFNIELCAPYRPQTKGKIEKTMSKLEDLSIYNGQVKDLLDVNIILNALTDEFNNRQNAATSFAPDFLLKHEKSKLNSLPNNSVMNSYTSLNTRTVKVDKSGMIFYKKNYYSVPYVLVGKNVTRQISDNKLYIFYMDLLVASHLISRKHINKYSYHDPMHKSKSKYVNSVLENDFALSENEIAIQALQNLKQAGEL